MLLEQSPKNIQYIYFDMHLNEVGEKLLKIKEFFILAVLVIAAVLPIVYGFYYIDEYGVNIPVKDQWTSLVPWTIEYYEGTFDPTILITDLRAESRLLFPGLVMVGISAATRMDVKTIFYAGYLFYACFLMLVAWLLFKELDIEKKYFLICILPVFYYAYNPYFLYRIIYNLGSTYAPMILFFVLLTIYALDRSKNQVTRNGKYLFFGLSLLFGIMCSFSGSPGLTIWFAGLFQIMIQDTREKIIKGIVWIIGAGALYYTYFIALEFNSGTTLNRGAGGYSIYLMTAMTYPLNKFLCFMGVLGAEVIHNANIALYFGILLTVIFILLLYTNRSSLQLDKYSKWYTLMVYGVLTGLALALTRSGVFQISNFGPPDTIFYIPAMRHSLYIFLPMMCIYILALIYTRDSLNDRKIQDNTNSPYSGKLLWNIVILGMVLILMVCGAILHIMPGISIASHSYDNNIKNQYYLLNYDTIPESNFKQMSSDTDIIKKYAPKLERYNLSVFANRENTIHNMKISIVWPNTDYD
jgi:hypothetical protein